MAPFPEEGKATAGLVATAFLAIALPTLIAFNRSPSATFFNQATAFLGWGLFLMVVAAGLPEKAWPKGRGTTALLAALGVLVLASLAAPLTAHLPWPLSLSSAGTMLAAMLAIVVGACAARAGAGERAFFAVCIAFVVAGVGSSVVGIVQVYAPNLADGDWIAASAPGRATGNLRQPNHLSSLLLWSVVAAVWLAERRPSWRWAMWGLALLFVEVIVLSASRTGLAGVLVLVAWGVLDRRLSRGGRVFLLCLVLAYAAFVLGSWLLAQAAQQPFEASKRMTGSGLYMSYSRYRIWVNSVSLIAMHPWLGVGFGEFNFAWTLTPFPNRPVAFFDHAHNVLLQFAVELGVPITIGLTFLFGYALRAAWRHAVEAGREPGSAHRLSRIFSADPAPASTLDSAVPAPAGAAPLQRAGYVIVLLAVVHSMLEYPLWYSYFLLPAAFVFGLCLERPDPAEIERARAVDGRATRPLVLASMLLVLGASIAAWDYLRVVVIFEPPADAAPLEQRIAQGRRSFFFAHHADYAAATVTDQPGRVLKAFDRATHFLLDTRIMMAWANALAQSGQDDKARYVAARLQEFHNEASKEFFAVCDPANAAAAASAAAASAAAEGRPAPAKSGPPFQCLKPERGYRFEDFR